MESTDTKKRERAMEDRRARWGAKNPDIIDYLLNHPRKVDELEKKYGLK